MLSIALERMDPRLIELCKCDGKYGNPVQVRHRDAQAKKFHEAYNKDPQASDAAGLPATSMLQAATETISSCMQLARLRLIIRLAV